MQLYLTDGNHTFEQRNIQPRLSVRMPEMKLVKVYPHIAFQEIIGFGAALTESAGYVYSLMDDETRKAFIDLCFSTEGNRYSLARICIQSCDFSLEVRAYLNKRDETLAGFSIDADKRYVLPLVKDALAANPALEFLASPWSPPAWAKTNASMKRGGHLRSRDCRLWARMVARCLAAYRACGVRIGRITVQNEPNAIQKWESCLYNAGQEAKMAALLKEELANAGLGFVKVLIWDHNKEGMFDRASACLNSPYKDAIDGVAFHWYSGDHFEAVAATSLLIGKRELIFSEGCDFYSAGSTWWELPHAEHYAHEVIGDLEAGAQGILDWNILLDANGGPNHVGNYCDAPLMFDTESHTLNVRKPFYYLGHFSRFIFPGARRLLSTRYTTDLETCAFANQNGTHALVALNRTDHEVEFNLNIDDKIMREHAYYPVTSPAHSIMTITW